MLNIVTTIQEQMGFGPFEKIDPNKQQGKKQLQLSAESDHYAQAATVAVVAGLYKFGETTNGAEKLINSSININLSEIFFNNQQQIINKVCTYGNKSYEETEVFMQSILNNAREILHKETGSHATIDDVYTFLAPQRHNALIYLPSDLEIGDALNDNTLEDRTNKMEGPISTVMHKIEDLFSAKDSGQPDKK